MLCFDGTHIFFLGVLLLPRWLSVAHFINNTRALIIFRSLCKDTIIAFTDKVDESDSSTSFSDAAN